MDLRHCQSLICVLLSFVAFSSLTAVDVDAQINIDQVMKIGRNALCDEDYILSIQYFNQVIAQKPSLAEPYFLRSVAKVSLDDWTGAESDASRCIEINPFIMKVYCVRAVARHNLHNFEDAMTDYDMALEFFPNDKDLLVNRAMCELELKHYSIADSCLRGIVERDPTFERAYLGLARLCLVQNDTLQALDHLSKAIDLNKTNAQAYIMRCNIFFKVLKDIPKALEDINEAINLEPRNAELYVYRSYMRYLINDLRGSVDDLEMATSIDPDNVTAQHNMALLGTHVEGGGMECVDLIPDITPKAKFGVNQLLDRVDGHASHRNKSRVYIQDIDVEVMPQRPFSLSYYNHDNNLNGRTHVFKEMAQFNDLKVLPSPLTLTSGNQLSAYDAVSRFESVGFFNRLISSSQPKAVDFFGRAMDFLMLRNVEAAIADADKAIELDHDFVLAYFLRFNARFLKNEMDVEYNYDPADDDAAAMLNMRAKQENVDLMIEDLNVVLRYSPGNTYAYYNLALVQAMVGDTSNALINYSKAIELNPDLGEAYFNRGLIYIQLGDKEKGVADLSKAGELGVISSYNILKRIQL